jgi:hypothetical protein
VACQSEKLWCHLERRRLLLMAISQETSQYVHQEICWAAMTTVFNLGNVFQLIVDGFDQHPFAQEQFVVEPDQAWFHIPLDRGEQFYATLHQPRKPLFGQIAFITDQFAKEALSQLWNWAAIIHVARGEAASEEVAAVVDD